MNEGNFSDLNLQSYRPGLFVERSIETTSSVLVPRWKYDFTQDDFSGSSFAYRHALSSSLASYWNDGDATIAYDQSLAAVGLLFERPDFGWSRLLSDLASGEPFERAIVRFGFSYADLEAALAR